MSIPVVLGTGPPSAPLRRAIRRHRRVAHSEPVGLGRTHGRWRSLRTPSPSAGEQGHPAPNPCCACDVAPVGRGRNPRRLTLGTPRRRPQAEAEARRSTSQDLSFRRGSATIEILTLLAVGDDVAKRHALGGVFLGVMDRYPSMSRVAGTTKRSVGDMLDSARAAPAILNPRTCRLLCESSRLGVRAATGSGLRVCYCVVMVANYDDRATPWAWFSRTATPQILLRLELDRRLIVSLSIGAAWTSHHRRSPVPSPTAPIRRPGAPGKCGVVLALEAGDPDAVDVGAPPPARRSTRPGIFSTAGARCPVAPDL